MDWGLDNAEYFAAHAPPVPEWFDPTGIPPRPEIPEAPTDQWSPEEKEQWWDGDLVRPDQYTFPRVRKFAEKRAHAQRERAEWTANRNWVTEIQWRWEYSRRMLAEDPS